ncbi:MAG TPA: GntR family transcriptional regulator [Bacillales bacterium]|nr:GntR family transcriptional regulator [Bacillales bacterium]
MKTIDPQSFVPLYHQLKELLKEKIESGEWSAGYKIPSENELRQEFQISRNTVKKAIEDLVQDGLLNRIQGKGTFVSKPKLEQSLTAFYSFSKVLQDKGMNPKDRIISIKERMPTASVAKQLNLQEKQKVIELRRLRCANDEPMILETSFIPKSIVTSLSEDDLKKQSLYDIMEMKFGVVVMKAKEIFEPVLIRDYESYYLEVKEGSPALLLDRIAYNSEGIPVEFCRSIVRGDRCRFYTELI